MEQGNEPKNGRLSIVNAILNYQRFSTLIHVVSNQVQRKWEKM